MNLTVIYLSCVRQSDLTMNLTVIYLSRVGQSNLTMLNVLVSNLSFICLV